MEFAELHGWEMDYKEAVALQRELAERVIVADRLPRPVRRVAGVDVSYEKHGDRFHAGVVVLELPGLEVVEEAGARATVTFPYIPGLLSFRELPVVLEAFRNVRTVPDAILVDGQGIAHPRRLGVASHLGLWLDLPTVGCAKTRLCGEHGPPGRERGDRAPLCLQGDRVGMVLTTRSGVNPMFISPGHRTDVDSAVNLVLACTARWKMPEPTRLAHQLTNRLRRQAKVDPD